MKITIKGYFMLRSTKPIFPLHRVSLARSSDIIFNDLMFCELFKLCKQFQLSACLPLMMMASRGRWSRGLGLKWVRTAFWCGTGSAALMKRLSGSCSCCLPWLLFVQHGRCHAVVVAQCLLLFMVQWKGMRLKCEDESAGKLAKNT